MSMYNLTHSYRNNSCNSCNFKEGPICKVCIWVWGMGTAWNDKRQPIQHRLHSKNNTSKILMFINFESFRI